MRISAFITAVMLLACLLISCGASSADVPGFSTIAGSWLGEDGMSELLINDEGQTWSICGDAFLFRGYMVKVELTESDFGFEYGCRYELHRDDGELMSSHYHDKQRNILLYQNTDGNIVDRYSYTGEFGLDVTEQ